MAVPKSTLGPEQYERFLVDYERELLAAMGDRSPCFFPFSRILFVARRPDGRVAAAK